MSTRQFDENNFNYLCDLYPEMKISKQSIIIFKTNIYNLYKKILNEYGEDWRSQDLDIAYLLTKEKNEKLYKTNFINIFLIFDFERQDSFYDDNIIIELQKKFNDPTDNGKLYINFPMIESFLDFDFFLDKDYYCKKMSMDNYKCYKTNVKVKSFFWEDLSNYFYIVELLKKIGKNVSNDFAWEILDDQSKLNEILKKIEYIETKKKNNHLFNIRKIINKYDKEPYSKKMKRIFNYLIKETIMKSILVQNNFVPQNEYKYDEIDFNKILSQEIELYNSSKDIYVLGTWILLVPEYNPKLIN